MKKKIIFVTKALWIGGIETALVNLLNHFDYSRFDVTLLILHAEIDMLERINPRCRVLIADREKTVSFNTPYKYSRLFHLTEEAASPSLLHRLMMWTVPIIKWIENCLYIKYVRGLMAGEKFDTAVIYSDVAAETTIKAVKAKKYLMYYHHGAMRHVYHDEIAYRRCEKIIAVSNNQAEELKKFVPEAKEKIIAIHNLTDVDGIRKKAQEPIPEHFETDKINIVSVGRVSHEKGMDIAVRACAKLVADGYDNVRWWIVGDGPAMPEVKAAIEETGMQEHIITVGMKPNPYPYIRMADLYVQPSRFEGNPMTIMEALILGQPVVSTKNNGAKELLQDCVTGMMCEENADNIADIVKRLIKRKNELDYLKTSVSEINFYVENKKLIVQFEKIIE